MKNDYTRRRKLRGYIRQANTNFRATISLIGEIVELAASDPALAEIADRELFTPDNSKEQEQLEFLYQQGKL